MTSSYASSDIGHGDINTDSSHFAQQNSHVGNQLSAWLRRFRKTSVSQIYFFLLFFRGRRNSVHSDADLKFKELWPFYSPTYLCDKWKSCHCSFFIETMILQNPIPGMIFESDGSARDIFADPLQMSQAGMPSFLEMLQNCKNLLLTFDKVQNPLRLPRKTTSERPKVVRDPQFLTLLTSKMCFAPQWRALFRHLSFQKCSELGVLCTFWLWNVFRATTACIFSTYQLPKVVRTWGVLYILTWTCASRHKGVQFFISHLARWLRTRRFSERAFGPSRATHHWKKHSESRLSYFFAHLRLLSSHSFSSLIFSSLLWLFRPLFFHLSILSEVWLLNFLRLYSYTMLYPLAPQSCTIVPTIPPGLDLPVSIFAKTLWSSWDNISGNCETDQNFEDMETTRWKSSSTLWR